VNIMKAQDLKLRCYAAQERDGSWYVVCLDLCLFASGDSFLEVRNKLHILIKDYIAEALTTDRDHIDSLIPRRAPLSSFIYYYYLKFLNKIRHHQDKFSKVFFEALPLCPL
jgi:hypothetical protein